MVIFFGSIYVLDGVDSLGRELNFWQMGVVLFSLVHVTVHLKIALVFCEYSSLSVNGRTSYTLQTSRFICVRFFRFVLSVSL